MKNYGIAIDIGTTTLTCGLIDLAKKKEAATCVEANPQAGFGADVVSRIGYCLENKTGLSRLHKSITGRINTRINILAAKAGIKTEDIEKIVVVANTAMEHFFLNEPVEKLSEAPYSTNLPKGVIKIEAGKIGISSAGGAVVYILPVLKSFLGSDITAGILYSALHKKSGPNMFIDIGTNGEMALSRNKKIFIASAAAGPAFEDINKNFHASELIEILSFMLKSGIIDKSGRIVKTNVETPHWGVSTSAALTQNDIRKLQLAKAAIAAGMHALVKKTGIKFKDISALFIAGKFGNYIDKKAAIRIGLLPDMPENKIKFIGNAAYKGACLALCNERALKETEAIAKSVVHVALFGNKDFKEEFVKQMGFNDK